MSLIHPSPDFVEIMLDDQLAYLLFPISNTEYVAVDRSGVYTYLIPVEVLQEENVEIDELPVFSADRTAQADSVLLGIAKRYVEQIGEFVLRMEAMYKNSSRDKWVSIEDEE